MDSEREKPSGVFEQLESLRSKLLDLSLRNRMLNYRPSKRLSITVVGEDSASLLMLLVEQNKRMSFVGKPDPPRRQGLSDPTLGLDDEVALAEFRRAAEDELFAFLESPATPVSQLDSKLNTEEYESVLQVKLRSIQREAQLANEELGINTLFLTLGVLQWRESAERSYIAPLLFLPVRLERQGNGSIRLLHDGSDVGGNLPLLAKLKEFNLKLPEYDEEKGVSEFFSQCESTIKHREDWEVQRDIVHLGFFNYEKYAMYRDLSGENWPEDKKPWNHEDLVAMLAGGYAPIESPIQDGCFVDDFRPVEDSHEVYDADGSQTIAMLRAASGLSIVVEGPPGTGKSQTITNIIAEAVSGGKRVLFVSAKRAALDVVRRRLTDAGLGAICLDLHDKLTNRREFYQEIKRTSSLSLSLKSEADRMARLSALRDRLTAHDRAVNTVLEPYQITPFRAMSELACLPTEVPEDRDFRIPFEHLQVWAAADFQARVPAVRALAARTAAIGVPSQHPFWGCELRYLDPALRLDLEQGLLQAKQAIDHARAAIDGASSALQIGAPETPHEVVVLSACVERAASAPKLGGIAVRSDTWVNEYGAISESLAALKTSQTARKARGRQVTSTAWDCDHSKALSVMEQFAPRWYRWLAGPFRDARREARTASTQEAPRDVWGQLAMMRDLVAAQQADRLLRERAELLKRLYGVQWRDLETDAEVAEKLLEWMTSLHSAVKSGDIPEGLLSLLSGSFNVQVLSELSATACERASAALAAYRQAAEHLQFSTTDAEQESWQDLHVRVASWEQNLRRLTEYIGYSEARAGAASLGLQAIIEMADTWPLAHERLEATFKRSYYAGIVRQAMEMRSELRTFEREVHEAAIRDFQELDDFELKYNRARVRQSHQQGMPRFDFAAGNLHALKLQCELQRRHKSIRWAMSKAGEAIQRIKPVFMMSPLTVAIHLPPEMPQFDMVIFDEASQVKPEDALCAIIRARQTIVVGDTRQLPPTNFFDRIADDEDVDDEAASEEQEFGQEARKVESILSLMSVAAIGRTRRPDLRWHYRSVHPALIQPSNELFYENRLIVFPSASVEQDGQKIGVVFHHHPETEYEGGTNRRINRAEAKIVADAVVAHLEWSPLESLLVAAMNRPQAELIWQELQIRERQRPEIFAAFRARHPHEPLDVKNLENVQGDERDVIFISVTYGRDRSGIIRRHFGPLLRDGGERRLNVLITRARRRCEVFSNLQSDDIRVEDRQAGLTAFKTYLGFAESGQMSLAATTGEGTESPFEEEVLKRLTDIGYRVDCQVGSEGYRLDLAVVDPERQGSYLLGIECDGATYHSAQSARDRDKLRQRVLEDRGWKIHRIWSHDWWQDRESEIERLVQAIEDAKGSKATEGNVGPPLASDVAEPELVEVDNGDSSINHTQGSAYVQAETVLQDFGPDRYVKSIERIVRAEGPICTDLLIKRMRDMLGFGRAGSQLRPFIEGCIQDAVTGKSIRLIEDAYVADDRQLKTFRTWESRPAAEKKPGNVPIVEIAAALRHVIRGAFGIGPAEAVKRSFESLGFARTTETAQSRGEQVLAKMVAGGAVQVRDEQLFVRHTG